MDLETVRLRQILLSQLKTHLVFSAGLNVYILYFYFIPNANVMRLTFIHDRKTGWPVFGLPLALVRRSTTFNDTLLLQIEPKWDRKLRLCI